MNKFLKLAASVTICEGTGFLGSIFTISSITGWYSTLNKPFFNPPNWIFGPVWAALYLLMGMSLFLVWENKKKNKNYKSALILFFVQLVLNFLWSILFFGLHSVFFASQEIIILWIFILFTIINFLRVSRAAGLILIPYALWVGFATVLNFSILLLNRIA